MRSCSDRSRWQFSLRTLFIVVTLSALILGLGVTAFKFLKDLAGVPWHVETFQLPDDRAIVIFAEWTERGVFHSYEIQEDSEVVEKRSWFHDSMDPLSGFDVIATDSGDLVAIVHSNRVLAIMDLRSNERWVSLDYPEFSTGERLLSQLRAEVPNAASLELLR